jgi:Predicted membrane protein (DUF2207)
MTTRSSAATRSTAVHLNTGKTRRKLRLYEIGFVILFLSAPLAAKSWRITDFQDSISVDRDAKIVVTERISLAFVGQWHGIHRLIPIQYPGPNGTNYELYLDVARVTDGEGNALKYDSSVANGMRDLKIYIPDAVDASRTVEIIYSVRNAVRFFKDYDEFYWNVTGNDWPVPIEHASATLTFPGIAAGSLRAQAFTGVYGSVEHDATSKVEGAEVQFETNNPLPMRGGLTIDVYIPKDILVEPSLLTRFLEFVGANPILVLPLVTLAGMFTLWWFKGRDPNPGVSVAPMYEPPPGISPAEAGTLLDDTIHPRDITCTMVDLAVRGYIKIEERVEKGLLISHKDYVFYLLQPSAQWKDTNLAPHERVMLEHIFGGGMETHLSELRNRFYMAVPIIRHDIMAALRNKGIYTLDPESAYGLSFAGAVAILLPFGILQYTGLVNFFNSIPLLVVSLLVSALIWWLFARVMTAKTVKGARTRVAVLGFQEFMNRVDAERLKVMPPTTFEKFLPYAMALGVEHHWASAFSGIVKDPPSWYVVPSGYYPGTVFNPIFFSNTMGSMTSDMQQVFVSAPRASSTGSGFSSGGGFGGGGGFSGGGFGGGGGGAF